MSTLTPVNRLLAPSGTADTTINQGGTLSSGGTSLTLTSAPSNWPATGILRCLIYKVGDTNHEVIDIDLGSRSTLTYTIARATEEATALPACSHADGAGIWVVATAAMLGLLNGGHSYLGYNTVGASNESATNDKVYLKQIVVPVDGLISSIGAFITTTADQVVAMNVGLWTDNAGAPGVIIAGSNSGQSQGTGNPGFVFETSASGPVLSPQKWVHMPIGTWLPAGTYWIGVEFHGSGGVGNVNLAYDTGADHTDTVTIFALSDIGRFTGATTARKYSIRADFITPGALPSGSVTTVTDSRVLSQTAANATVATYTVGSTDGSFQVVGNVNVTASVTHSFTMTVAYTDETNTSRTLTLTFSNLAGTLLTAITNVLGVGPYEGLPLQIRAKAGTTITFATTGTFTSVTYNAEGTVIKVA